MMNIIILAGSNNFRDQNILFPAFLALRLLMKDLTLF